MLIKNLEKLLDNRLGVIHVGASAAEERDWYYTRGFEPIYWIEADPNKIFNIQDNIREYENQYCINAAISDKEEEVNFYITSNEGVSSSLMVPNLRPEIYDNQSHVVSETIKVKTKTLKRVIEEYRLNLKDINFLSMDIEGSELNALKSLGDLVKEFEFIQCEYHTHENYIGCPMLTELVEYLKPFGFEVIGSQDSGEEWGDVLFKKVK
jgi:FkbM family methyltransferase